MPRPIPSNVIATSVSPRISMPAKTTTTERILFYTG